MRLVECQCWGDQAVNVKKVSYFFLKYTFELLRIKTLAKWRKPRVSESSVIFIYPINMHQNLALKKKKEKRG